MGIPTPVSRLYERISVLDRPTGMTHIVDKQSTQLCISKQMVKTCLSKPLSIKQRSVEFACVPQPSVMARSLEKRALAGESLFQEISQLPTVFRKVELSQLLASLRCPLCLFKKIKNRVLKNPYQNSKL